MTTGDKEKTASGEGALDGQDPIKPAAPEAASGDTPAAATSQPETPSSETTTATPAVDAAAVAPAKPTRAGWKYAAAALFGIVMLSAAAVSIYVLFFDTDRAWETCKAPAKMPPDQRIKSCGEVVMAATKPPQAMALAYRARAKAFFEVGEIASAVQDFSSALAIVTDDPALYAERGFAQLRNGQPAQAIEDFSAATALDASLVEPLVGRGNAYMALSQHDLAAHDFTLALTLKPDLPEAVYRRALANVRLSRIADAASDYDRALELSPKNPNYWNARCWFRATMSIDMDLALSDCDAALKIKPGFAPALDSRAFVLLRLSRFQEALAAYDTAIAAESRYAWPYFGRGIVKKRLGDEAGAQADFEAARSRQADIDQQYANYGETP